MDMTLTLCLPRDAVSVPLSRRVTSQLLLSVGFLADDVDEIELALTEACSNVLRHSESDAEYEVRLDITADLVVITVQDMGSGLPDGTLERLSARDGDETGRGIPLMRALVDDLKFLQPEGEGSVVRMERRLRPDPGSRGGELFLEGQRAAPTG